jgi:predicted TIM-barrel fold metal-dependent hydrolase
MTDALAFPPLLIAGEKCCDCHVHAYGPPDQFPLAPGGKRPPHASPEEYLADVRRYSVNRHVFVQSGPSYGLDNSSQLRAVQMVGADARAIVALAEDATDKEIASLHNQGARGVRLTATLTEPPTTERLEWMKKRIEHFDSRLAGTEWCIELLMPGWMTEAMLPTLHKLQTKFVVGHCGMFPAQGGVNQSGFVGLLKLLAEGSCWIKLTGLMRWSQSLTFDDTIPMIRALADVAPDRLIWGSDHPHSGATREVPNSEFLALVCRCFPTAEMQRQILVKNPEVLFGFAA